jgi:hypothetical protein
MFEIRNFVFIADDNDNGDKLFTGVNNTGDKFSPLSFPPVIKPSLGFSSIPTHWRLIFSR